MMEALDKKQTKPTSNQDADEAGEGSGSGNARGAAAGGAVVGEEDEIEDPHHTLGVEKEADEKLLPAQEQKQEPETRSTHDVIDLTLANGQDSSDGQERASEDGEAFEDAGEYPVDNVEGEKLDEDDQEKNEDVQEKDDDVQQKQALDIQKQDEDVQQQHEDVQQQDEDVQQQHEDVQQKHEKVQQQDEDVQQHDEDIEGNSQILAEEKDLLSKAKVESELDEKMDSPGDHQMEFLSDSEDNQKLDPQEAKVEAEAQPKEELEEAQKEVSHPLNVESDSEDEHEVTPPTIDLDSDSAEEDFHSIDDNKSPAVPSEGENEEAEAPKDAPVEASSPSPTDALVPEREATPSPTLESPQEDSGEEDSPALTMDVDIPSSDEKDSPPEVQPEIKAEMKVEAPSETFKDSPSPIKLNGAHQEAKEEDQKSEAKERRDKDEMEKPQEQEALIEEPGQEPELSVISNHSEETHSVEARPSTRPAVAVEDAHVEPTAGLPLILPTRRSRSRSTSSGSSTVSSASQPQLVIDHPDSEQNNRAQSLKLPLKRRRSKSSTASQPEKQMKLDDSGPSSSSLLLQRLQAPPPPTAAANGPLSCAKCGLQFDYESFQQLNEHQAQCSGGKSASSSGTTSSRVKKERFFRCAQCSSVHQCWNFFLHMREVHQRYICLYCSHVYPSVEKLSLHLENKHDIDQSHFAKEAWAVQQRQEDRLRHLICCTCQATFAQGSEFEEHDCSQLMQPCALCGERGGHVLGCRNSKRKPIRKKRKTRKLPDPVIPPQQVQPPPQVLLPPQVHAQAPQYIPLEAHPAQEQPQAPFPLQQSSQDMYPVENIPAPEPIEDPPAPPIPKLVVPKIMLRVPKEFQKSVDAALSSTDTEEEEIDTTQPSEEAAPVPLEDVAPSPPAAAPPTNSLDESPSAKLSRVLAELERTKLDIERTKADMIHKKQAKVIPAQEEVPDVEPQVADPPLQLQQQPQPEEQRRWSLTPPASPHNNTNHINLPEQPPAPVITEFQDRADAVRRNSLGSDCMDMDDSINGPETDDRRDHPVEASVAAPQSYEEPEILEVTEPPPPPPPADGIIVAGPDTQTMDLQLDRALDRISMVDFVRLCLRTVYATCLYCNHARRIAVNGKQLVLHLIRQHRFTATVDSITAEELHAETIVARLKSFLPQLEQEYLNSASYCSMEDGKYVEPFNERIYECFSCRFVTSTHKELYTHNRRLHIKSNITCMMCQTNFYSYSEILCHICPGEAAGSIYDLNFRCCLCDVAPLPSAFRLMVHLRKQHQACDICLEDCQNQTKLSAHVWKHKLLHLCYRCGIAYRNKQDISKHLFWKHGTESASCKRCLQKRWRHVYHFCVPPAQFSCEQCGFNFSKAIYLEVHQRMHTGDFRYACAEEGCEEKFVSRKLLLKHASSHVVKEIPEEAIEEPNDSAALKSEDVKKEEGEDAEAPSRQPDEKKAPGDSAAGKEEPGDTKDAKAGKDLVPSKSENRKKRKKAKRNKESLEDLNLIAPNLSESDSSDDSDSDAPRSSHQEVPALPMRSSVDDLDMPKVMLSPSSESDGDETADCKPKVEEKASEKAPDDAKDPVEKEDTSANADSETKKEEGDEQVDVSIWKNLLQNQPVGTEGQLSVKQEEDLEVEMANKPPAKLHVAWSDHDYCKLHRTPPPSPAKKPATPKSAKKGAGRHNASSDSDSSSSSSSSDSDSSSCSCGSNCSCSSSNSSSSSDDSDDSASSTAAGSPQKRQRKKSLRQKKNSESTARGEPNDRDKDPENVNISVANEENLAAPPSPKPPMYNESDFDTNVSDTDEEFYDSHPQKLANELLAQKREALLAEHAPLGPSNNYDIVENSRPSTPSLPEEAAAFADKRERVRNKKKKRERKSTCKSGKMPPAMASDHHLGMPGVVPLPVEPSPVFPVSTDSSLFPVTPLTHRHLQPSLTRMSEGSSSDADGQLKRSKRQRRPNKFYGYTSDDENMSTILAPPLQVGMQLIKPQPPPQLTWAKEDLPTPPKQRSRNNNHHHHSHSNGGTPLAGSSSRKRSKQRSLLGAGSSSRSAKRHKPDREEHHGLPPIPTLKIRPSLLPSSAPQSDSSDSSSDDEDVEVNVTSLVDSPHPATPLAALPPPPPVLAPPPVVAPVPMPPTPATTAFNQPIPPALLPNPGFATLQYFKANNIRYPIRPPAGARLAREGECVYCYCRCPYDEVSEMIACDGDNCQIEWFHFECVGIMVAPQGKWFCAECRPKYSDGAKPQ
ncbi:uncharacterized protein Dana_GF11347, isoform A [Drosophila ananassae]|uniref:Uncharacterized protein, isoform A n=1 Tax=Drosophila ananassae TaxID=7217 RepID=B3ME20_DROAN|nr:uncharacterized protein LOC6494211 isoform X1 [Drosophila ananassae]EDV37565.1 uncharacterized protein Dana_GF11347, isoform A [Drosophila ananassae]